MGVHVRAYDRAGVQTGILPHLTSLSFADIFSKVGAVALTYAADGLNASLLTDPATATLGVYLDGEEIGRAVVEDHSADETSGDAALSVNWRTTHALLARARVYPQNGVANPNPFSQSYTATNVATLIKDLVAKAQARGAIPGVTTASFTAAFDSVGHAWTATESITRTFPAGEMTLLDVLDRLTEEGVIFYDMEGSDLRLYRAAAYVPVSEFVLRRGRDLVAMPRETSRRDQVTAMLVSGEQGTATEVVDAAAVTAYDRIEGYEAASGVTTTSEMQRVGNAALADKAQPAVSLTARFVTGNPNAGIPWTHYRPGDLIWTDREGGTVAQLRINALALAVEADGSRTIEAELIRAPRDPEIRGHRFTARALAGSTAYESGPIPSRPHRHQLLIASVTTAAAGITAAAGAEAKDTTLGNLTFTAIAGRTYRVKLTARIVASTASNVSDVWLRDGGTASPTTASPRFDQCVISVRNEIAGGPGAVTIPGFDFDVTGLSEGVHTIAVFFQRKGGTGDITLAQSDFGKRQLSVYEVA